MYVDGPVDVHAKKFDEICPTEAPTHDGLHWGISGCFFLVDITATQSSVVTPIFRRDLGSSDPQEMSHILDW